MLKKFLKSKLPDSIAKKASKIISTPLQARTFCCGYASCPEALQSISIQDLVEKPYLWKPTSVATKEQDWIREVYPKNIEYAAAKIKSIIACIKCKQNSVEYYEQQVRGADEPMTCFCQCTVPGCGKRWTQ